MNHSGFTDENGQGSRHVGAHRLPDRDLQTQRRRTLRLAEYGWRK